MTRSNLTAISLCILLLLHGIFAAPIAPRSDRHVTLHDNLSFDDPLLWMRGDAQVIASVNTTVSICVHCVVCCVLCVI